MINIGDREKMFRDHTRLLAEKRRTQFRKLLEDTPKVCVCVCVFVHFQAQLSPSILLTCQRSCPKQ